jgi:hypothetical protein
MHQTLVTFCHWLQNTPMALAIAHTRWGFPFIQLIHFGGLSVWVGTNAIVDLSLMGFGKKYQTAATLSDSLFTLNWTGLAIAVTGGFLLFSVAAGAYISNIAFETKLAVLIPLGLVLHVVNQRKARTWGRTGETPGIAKVSGALELLLWIGVIVAAVSIPYV